MLRRSLAILAVALLAAAVAGGALAARVHVRVEGKTTTIFGATEPVAVADDALAALETASVAGEFYYHVTQTGFGPYVDQIGRYPASGSNGWVFKVNGASPPVGADKVQLKDGDTVLWYWAAFGPSGGPKTLVLRLTRKPGCYQTWAQDDAGKLIQANGAVLHVDGRRVRTKAGAGCVGKHRGLVRGTLTGAVRSNALR